MKIKLSIFLAIILPTFVSGQELVTRASFKNIQYVHALAWYENEIYCSGYTFKTKVNDGNSTDAYLVNYDLSLRPKWSLKIADKPYNEIGAIIRYKEKIYALVSQGNIQPHSKDIFLTLYVILPDGSIAERIPLCRTFYSPSNIAIDGQHLVFGNTSNAGTSYSSLSTPEIIRYNLTTKKITRHRGFQGLYYPKKIIANNAGIFLSDMYLKPNRPNVISLKSGRYGTVFLKPKKEEYFLDSYVNKNILTTVCVFPGVYGDMNKYLKYYYLDLASKKINIKTIPYANLGWEDVRFSSFSNGPASWLIIKEAKTKQINYVLLDDKGNINSTLKFDLSNGNSYNEHYIFRDNLLLKANSSGIQLYKTE